MQQSNLRPREDDRPVAVEFTDTMLRVMLQDGRVIATPLAWYPRLQQASREEREHVELGFAGIHWPDIDEDLSVQGMLRGSRPPSQTSQAAPAKSD